MIREIKYGELPDFIKIDISENDFLASYQNENEGKPSLIVWTISRTLNRQIELEYDPSTNQKISIEERKARAPASSAKKLEDSRFELNESYFFEEGTNTLHKKYTLFDMQKMQEAGCEIEPYYPTSSTDPTDIAKSILKKYCFPTQYTQWNNEQRINYWTERLYRMRRQAGESGAHEDCAFDSALANEMLSIDSNIKNVLPDCIMKLAMLEQTDHANLLASFRNRTGILI